MVRMRRRLMRSFPHYKSSRMTFQTLAGNCRATGKFHIVQPLARRQSCPVSKVRVVSSRQGKSALVGIDGSRPNSPGWWSWTKCPLYMGAQRCCLRGRHGLQCMVRGRRCHQLGTESLLGKALHILRQPERQDHLSRACPRRSEWEGLHQKVPVATLAPHCLRALEKLPSRMVGSGAVAGSWWCRQWRPRWSCARMPKLLLRSWHQLWSPYHCEGTLGDRRGTRGRK